MAYTTAKGYHIPLDTLSSDEYENIRSDLTVTPVENDYTLDVDEYTFKVYKINRKKNQVIVPRHYGQKHWGVVPDKYKHRSIDIEFNGSLRDYQVPIVNQCLEHIEEHGGGILSVPCGYGKTLMAIYMAISLGLKTVILVHQSFLLDQWVERIREFSNARIGIIRQSTVQIKGYDIVIGMAQSIGNKKYDFKSFGTLIVDECHHYGARFFSKSLAQIGAKYTIGLSATPKRKDGLTKVVNWYLGDIMFQKKLQTNNQVVAKRFHYFTHHKDFRTKYRVIKGETKANNTTMISSLIKLKKRNDMIINIIDQLRKDPTRNILVLGERVEHLETLKEGVDALIQKDVEKWVLLPGECKTYYYMGKTKRKDREEAAEKGNILFGTYHIASEGFDVPRLNTLVLATPKADVVQSVGRILRRALENGDTRPLVIDIVDELSIFINQSYARQRLYNSSKYIVQNHYSYEGKLIGKQDYDNIKESKDARLTVLDYESELEVPVVEITGCGNEPAEEEEETKEECDEIEVSRVTDPLDFNPF